MSTGWAKNMNIWQSYEQERGCFLHFAHLANTLLKDVTASYFFTQNVPKCRILIETFPDVLLRVPALRGGTHSSIATHIQCRINHVADVANATGLRPQGGLRK